MKLCQQFIVDVVYSGFKDQEFTNQQIKHIENAIKIAVHGAMQMPHTPVPDGMKVKTIDASYNGDIELDC